MGRLRKAKIDRIIAFRKEGYTQAETAEKVGVHLKTVQRYDPLRERGKGAGTKSAARLSVDELENQLRTLGDWIEAVRVTIAEQSNMRLHCPKCMDGKLEWDEDRPGVFFCDQEECGYEMPLFCNVWEE